MSSSSSPASSSSSASQNGGTVSTPLSGNTGSSTPSSGASPPATGSGDLASFSWPGFTTTMGGLWPWPTPTSGPKPCGWDVVVPWCLDPPRPSAPLSEYCLCPFCWFDSPWLCSVTQPTATTDCPFGWLCSLTSTSGGTVSFHLPTEVTYGTTSPTSWNQFWETITKTDRSHDTTSVQWTATLSTSTKSADNGITIEFPFRVWWCLGSLCNPSSGLDLLNTLKCLIPFICPQHNDNGGWPFPPVRSTDFSSGRVLTSADSHHPTDWTSIAFAPNSTINSLPFESTNSITKCK